MKKLLVLITILNYVSPRIDKNWLIGDPKVGKYQQIYSSKVDPSHFEGNFVTLTDQETGNNYFFVNLTLTVNITGKLPTNADI